MLSNKDLDIQKLQVRVLVIYVGIIFALTISMMVGIIAATNNVLTNKISALVASNSHQLENNINSYLKRVELNAALMFSDEKYYKYDATTTSLDEYEKIKCQDEIAEKISDLGLMENYSDFAVLYSDGTRVGWTSNTTAGLFTGSALYNEFYKCIEEEPDCGKWVFGFGGVTDRMYYVRQLNPNAILICSFYSRELSSAFEYPDALDGSVVDLVDDNNHIMYSSDQDRIGNNLDEFFVKNINSTDKETIVTGYVDPADPGYILNYNYCENGWRVVCIVPKNVISAELRTVRQVAIIITTIIALICFIISIYSTQYVLKPVDDAVSDLMEDATTDSLSGLYNKGAFKDKVISILGKSWPTDAQAFIMIDMDNFKSINDRFGHSHGDDVIQRMGRLLQKKMCRKYVVGRIGGDEFAIYHCFGNNSVENVKEEVRKDISDLINEFAEEFKVEYDQASLSLSIGIVVRDYERRFNNLYDQADQTMYTAKKSGKNRYMIYDVAKEDEV